MSAFSWALVTAGIWGIVPLMEKVGLGQAPPAAGVVVRSLGVVAGLLGYLAVNPPAHALRGLTLPSMVLLGLAGLLASFVGQMVFYHALQQGELSQVVPVSGAYPLVAALLGWWVLREPMTGSRILGVLCVVTGLVLLRK